MKYLAIIYNDESLYTNASPEDIGAIFAAHGKFGEDSSKAGVFLGGEGLEPTSAATTVRVRDGERLLTDGPYAETKEQIGGYYLLECKDLDDALNWAAQIPEAKTGAIEVRPIMNFEAIEAGQSAGQAATS
ncbi:YciI family protein [Candidatus Solirubrobacter pratensis]|uniref:YciI family protein n=1 Tax=Candidatus Solirubrobacter pratensis TaxID=1298857 RepID=UPI0004023782|nr:YciI family protein [Candidatus Solirubrobacter pratensis]